MAAFTEEFSSTEIVNVEQPVEFDAAWVGHGVYDELFRETGGWTGFDVLLELAEAMADMPESSAMFSPRFKLPDEAMSVLYSRRLMELLGTWPVPDRFHTGRRVTYVNPSNPFAMRYAEAIVQCECGAWMAHERVRPDDVLCETAHTDDCCIEWREKARRKLSEVRMRWILRAADLWWTAPLTAKRMGVVSKTVDSVCERYGYDWSRLRLRGRSKAVRTWRELRRQGYTSKDIGTAFDSPANTVRYYTTKNMDVSSPDPPADAAEFVAESEVPIQLSSVDRYE